MTSLLSTRSSIVYFTYKINYINFMCFYHHQTSSLLSVQLNWIAWILLAWFLIRSVLCVATGDFMLLVEVSSVSQFVSISQHTHRLHHLLSPVGGGVSGGGFVSSKTNTFHLFSLLLLLTTAAAQQKLLFIRFAFCSLVRSGEYCEILCAVKDIYELSCSRNIDALCMLTSLTLYSIFTKMTCDMSESPALERSKQRTTEWRKKI